MTTTNPESLAALYRSTDSFREMYDLQRAYYDNNGLYDVLQTVLHLVDLQNESLKPLRNPAYRAVEFYPAHLWPGTLPAALPIVTKNAQLAPAIERIWTWSNWAAQKQVATRWLALYGDLFIKVAEKPRRVYLQLIDPRYVPDFETDERGFLTYFRSDVPQVVRDGDETEERTSTEEWDKAAGGYRSWLHDKGYGADIDKLGTPDEEKNISEFKVDFIPVVHVKFHDIGEDRGQGCFQACIDKIDEANRMATRLHGLLFRHNKPDKQLTGEGLDQAGRPIPAPKFDDIEVTTSLDKEMVYKLPSGWKLEDIIPNIHYQEALAILQDHMQELEQDLPELAWYRLKERDQELSGRAVRLMLGDAIDRVLEARGNAEAGLVRAHQMAISIGQVAGLFEAGLGTYDSGQLAHSFAERSVIPLDATERSQVFMNYRQNDGLSIVAALRMAGATDAEIAQVLEDEAAAAAQQETQLANAMLEAQRRLDQNRS